jgi:flagellar biosynthesis protein FlhB
MAEQQADLDRSEPATPYKLEKARERGSIVRSTELVFALVLLASVACVHGLGAQVMNDVGVVVRRGLWFAGRSVFSQASALAYLQALGSQALRAVVPVIFALWLTALVTAAMQAHGVFSSHPLKPDFSRLNPATGLKRMFSMKSLHELWRSTAKLVVLSFAMWIWGRTHLQAILQLAHRSPHGMARAGLALLGSALTLLAAVVLLFALLDFALNRRDFLKNMRMSKREIKDEHKDREGDPRIKSRLRELRLEWLKRMRQLGKVRSADVLLTNPTHYAVALEYRHGEMPAPMITARGAGELARRMRAEAYRRAVPVVENVPLTRALFALKDQQTFVPEEHFEQVARVLRWVYAARASRSAGQASA